MASASDARLQASARKVSEPKAMAAPSEYEVETGQAFAQEPMAEAKKEGMSKGALSGLGVGASLGGAALSAGTLGLGAPVTAGLALSGPLGWGVLAAGLLGSAAIGGAFGSSSAKKAELTRQQEGAKSADIAAISGQAMASQDAKMRRENAANAKKTKGYGASTSTPDDQVLAGGMASGSGTGFDTWHRGQVG
tara:strand:- start:1056 stop:1634 length:579 start_codon:yes stop_codon:yes gene_type:complete